MNYMSATDDGYSDPKKPSKCVRVSRVLLALVTLGFVIIGSFLIHFGIQLSQSKWIEIFSQELIWLQSATLYCVVGFGVVLIFISLIGFVGNASATRTPLLIYFGSMILAVVCFLLLTIASLGSLSVARTWTASSYPASAKEPQVGVKFDLAYCASQGIYFCTKLDFAEGLEILQPGLLSNLPLSVRTLLPTGRGIYDLCTKEGAENFPLNAVKEACEVCQVAKKYEDLSVIYEWAQEECPNAVMNQEKQKVGPLPLELSIPVPSSQVRYCQKILSDPSKEQPNGGATDTTGSPYRLCRSPILELWRRWSLVAGVGTLMALLLSILIAFMIQTVRHASKTPKYVDTTSSPAYVASLDI